MVAATIFDFSFVPCQSIQSHFFVFSVSNSNFWDENFLNFTLVVCFYQILKNSIAFVPEKIRLIFCRGIISFVSTCGQNPGCFTPAAKLVFYQRQTYVLPMPRAVFCWPASDNAPPTGFCPNIKTEVGRPCSCRCWPNLSFGA